MGIIETIPHLSRAAAHAPWPRVIVDEVGWTAVARDLATGQWTLVSVWAEQNAVHMALFEGNTGEGVVVSYECRDRRFPSVCVVRPSAIRPARASRGLFGLDPVGLW